MKYGFRKAVNILIGVISIAAWLYMVFSRNEGGMLASGNLSSLKYFTVLSNLLNGIVCLIYAVRKEHTGYMMQMCKLIGTTGVSLTFLTVTVFLGPVFGYGNMYRGANFWMHLVLPVLSVFSYIAWEEKNQFTLKQTAAVMLFPLLYEIGYVGNILLNGIREWPDTNDFYGFLTWGNAVGAVIAVSILLSMWVIAIVLVKVQNRKRYRI